MKRMLMAAFALLLAVAVAAAAYVYLYGGPRVKCELAAFAEQIAGCTPFEQAYYVPMSGGTMKRTVHGPTGETCRVSFATLGPQTLDCAFDTADLPDLARALVAQGEAVDAYGYADLRVSTSDPDPLTRLMNSDACRLTGG